MYNEGIAYGDGCGGARFAITVTLLSHHSNLLRKFANPYGDDLK